MTEVLEHHSLLYSQQEVDELIPEHCPESAVLNPMELTLHGSGSAITGVKYLSPCSADTPIHVLKQKYLEDGVLWVSRRRNECFLFRECLKVVANDEAR